MNWYSRTVRQTYWRFFTSHFPLPTYYGYNCQRYYCPPIGRFITLNPFGGYIELPQTQNRYAYCINNPLKYIDPLGLYEVWPFLEKPPLRDVISGYKYTPPLLQEEIWAWSDPTVRGNTVFDFDIPTTPPGTARQVIATGQLIQNYPHWAAILSGKFLQLWGYYSILKGIERTSREIFGRGSGFLSSPFSCPDFNAPSRPMSSPAPSRKLFHSANPWIRPHNKLPIELLREGWYDLLNDYDYMYPLYWRGTCPPDKTKTQKDEQRDEPPIIIPMPPEV